MLPTLDRATRRPDTDNDAAQSAAAAAAAQAARESAQRIHDPAHRAAAGWGLAGKTVPANASPATRAEADAAVNARTALERTDLPAAQRQQVQDAVLRLGNGLVDGKVDPHVNDAFRQDLYKLATEPHDSAKFRGALAQMSGAADALGRAELAPGSKLVYDPRANQPEVARAGLPELTVPKIDADVYYKTADGVLHLDGAKATPEALSNEVRKAIAEGPDSQLGRQSEWERAGTVQDPRRLGMFVLDGGPGFSNLMDGKNVAKLAELAGNDLDARRFVVGDRAYSVNDFKQIIGDAKVKADAHVATLRQQHLDAGGEPKAFKPGPAYAEFYRTTASSTEQAARSYGATYGEARPPLKALDPASLPSLKQGGAFGAVAAGGLTFVRVASDGKLTMSEAGEVAKHTALGGATGVVAAAGEKVVTPVVDRAIGTTVQRTATSVAGRVASQSSAEATAAFGAGARTLVSRAGGATVVGAVIATGISAYENRDGLAKGDSKAIGNVTADATVAVGSIAAATAAGAAIGSVVPVAGTAVGAVVGLAVGVGVAYGAQISGARDAVANTVSGWVDGVKGWF